MRVVAVGDEEVLLSRDGDAVHAVGAKCPHAGAPLIEGVRHGDRIVCPWHNAVFCLTSGRLLEPPAADPLPRYRVRIAAGRILIGEAATPPTPVANPADDVRTFVIVGGGAAGAFAAQTLREEGFAGAIVMLDRENRVPYDRTLLSKYALSGEPGAEKTPLQSQAWYRAHRIERRTARVSRIDCTRRLIQCEDGASIAYDKALIATGADPVSVDLPGHALKNVFTLRSRADADAILAQAERGTRAAILGTSFIGMEVAAALRERGLDVTVIGKEAVPFAKRLGATIGKAFVGLHEAHGVALKLGRTIAAIEGQGHVERVRLDDGTIVEADLVVAGFGVRPATGFLSELDRTRDGGILVDDTLRLCDDLYAAGDIAAFAYRGERIRVEHWRVAAQHGRIAARSMLGLDARYAGVPVFWTIQYMKRLDYIGHAEGWDDIVVHGDIMEPKFLAYYVKDGLVAAAAGMDRDQDTAALTELMAMRAWSADELGDDPKGVLARMQPGASP